MKKGKVWFSGDLHACHDNIIDICGRPYKNSTEMVKSYISNHNELVSPHDQFFFLGDLMMGKNYSFGQKILKQLNGKKHIILGNHDEFKAHSYISMGFESAHTSYMLTEFIYLNHDPSAATINKKAIWICGHIHDLFKTCKNVYNAGVDVNDFKPVSLDLIFSLARMNQNGEWSF